MMFTEYYFVTIILRITENFTLWKITENNFLIAVCAHACVYVFVY